MSDSPDGVNEPRTFGSGFGSSQSQRYVLSGSVLLTVALCLVFVIVLITLLHLYGCYLTRRQRARNRRAPALFNPSVPSGHHVHHPKTGLDPAVIAALPKFVYKNKDLHDQQEHAAPATDECSVCLSPLEEGATVRQLPACQHTFHDTCIDTWLHSHNTCPLCRKVVGPISDDPPTEPAATVEVVVVVQVGSGGTDGNSGSASTLATTSPLLLMPGCGGGSGQGVSGHEEVSGAPSRLASFRRMFSLERSGVRRQYPRDEGAQRDLERQ